MVSDDRHAGGIVGVELRLEPNQALAARAGHRGPAATDAGLRERHARFLPGYAERPWGPDEAAVVVRGPPPPPAACSPARGGPRGAPPPAPPRRGATRPPLPRATIDAGRGPARPRAEPRRSING